MKNYKKGILPLIVMLVGVFLALHMINVTIKNPFVGIDVVKKGEQFIVKKVSSAGWGKENSIHKGDIVLSINDKDPNQHFTVDQYDTIEQADSIQLLKDNEIKHYTIKYSGFDHYYVYHLVFPVIFYLSCISISLFLMIRKEYGSSVTILIYLLNVFGITLISTGASSRKDVIGDTVTTFSVVFTLILLMHFLKKYFSKWNLSFIKMNYINYMYGIGLLIFIFTEVLKSVKSINLLPPDLIFFSITFIGINVLITKLYLNNRATEHKQIIQILVTGLYASFVPFIILFAIPTLLFNQPIMRAEMTTVFFILLPLSLLYLVVSEEFIDMEFVIRKLYYCLLISFVATAFIIIGFLLFTQSNILDNHIEIMRLSLIIFGAFTCVLYFKDKIDFLLRKRLYPKEKDFQVSLNRFLHTMKNETKLEKLTAGLQKEIEVNLPVSEATLVQVQEDNRLFSYLEKKEIIHHAIETMIQDKGQIGMIHKNSTGFSVPLSEKNGRFLVLIAEWRKPRKKLTTTEQIWLETIINYTQIMIENLYKIEEIMGKLSGLKKNQSIPVYISKLLLSISEKERKNLAIDLHDTILQDQLSLARKIDDEMTKINDVSFINLLNDTRESILDQAHVLREVTTELHPSFLHELGLRESLLSLFEKINLNANFLFYSELGEDVTVAKKSHELALYRIIQELLNNAMKHSKATEVHLNLFRKDDLLYLQYVDDGVGCDWNNLEQPFSTRGISGIKERVRGIDGSLKINSEVGKGFQAEIVLQLKQYSLVN
ncbi:hypothetical protein MXL46_16090 [Heyndrickxia sporothermodurans]|uniref:sensor histidine kinase n=1 Tax=Heyndrickxia sporothermodurans TaxID=46224 RepID=UPI002DBE1900|nr:ATP-binding protein [Heyndrickxia sporothermodurans]MEB6550589.1 hypothetical protein [Heyndrickxia sporothermodurans]